MKAFFYGMNLKGEYKYEEKFNRNGIYFRQKWFNAEFNV